MKNKCSEYNLIGKNIGQVHRASLNYFSKQFSKYNIGAGQYCYLLNLYRHPGITQEQLTIMVGLDKGTTARAIKKLEDEGYVIRKKRDDDKRYYSIFPTQKAENIKEEVFSIMDTWEEKLKNCFTEEESKEFIRLLNKLNNSDLFKGEEIE